MASKAGPSQREAVTTGVVIVDHGSRRAASNEMLERFVARFAEQHAAAYPIVEPAHMELAEPSIATAFDRCVERGAARVAVCPYFLAPGKHWHQDIPNLAREAALRHPQVSYAVTAPIGLSPMIQDVIVSQLSYCLGQIDGAHDECEWCRGTGRCAMKRADQTEPVVFQD